jgi:protein disulfide-isomerase A6
MIFSESIKEDGERYRGKEDINSMANAAARKMQNFVSIITESNYPSFCEREKTKHHVILFTDKKSTPAILKSLSKKYIDRLLIGEVRISETNLIQKFGIDVFPTLVILTDSEQFKAERYQGELKADQLWKFLDNYAYQTIK